MALEYARLFDAKAVSASSDVLDTKRRTYNAFLIKTAGFTGTIDIEGFGVAGTPITGNILYQKREVSGAAAFTAASAAQLTFTTENKTWLVAAVEPWPMMQLVMTRSAGSLTVDWLSSETAPFPNPDVDVTITNLNVGAVSIADGADVAEGTTTDSPSTDPAADATEIAILKGLLALLNPPTVIMSGAKNVTTAGVPEPLVGAPTPCVGVIVTAKAGNTGMVTVGGAGVLMATPTGTPLSAKQSMGLAISDAANVYVDVENDGEGVAFNILEA